MARTVILDGARTPIGKMGGALSDIPATQLGGVAMKAALARSGVRPHEVDTVLMGMVVQAGAGQIPSRQAAVSAGIPLSVPAETINKVCASGMRAVTLADSLLRAGDGEVVAAGGMESMSQGPYLVREARWGARFGDRTLVDATLHDGLTCPFDHCAMGHHGESTAVRFGISRDLQDRWALRSHRRAVAARARLEEEITPVEITWDEAPRPDTDLKQLARLRPVFNPEGRITAGNAPPLSDGAAVVVLMSSERARREKVSVMGQVVAHASVSCEPSELGVAPALAAKEAVKRAGIRMGRIGLFEVNEAFGAVVIAVMRQLSLDANRVNVNGGALALGHPIGATGARLILTLLYEMRRQDVTYGLAAMCSGGGQGDAVVLARP